jgi:7 transmembrane receptor (rhodopsin family)
MANVTFPPWPVESRCSNETPHVCYLNLTGEQSLSGNSTENGTNEAASETTWQLPLGACIFLITDTSLASSWIVMANLLVIISFLRDAKLRIIQNYYIVSLAMSDLMIGSIVLPLGLYSFLHNQGWPIRNAALCKFWMVIDYVNSLQSSLSVCLISYDRFKMILHPIEYRNEESPKRAMLRIACTWTFSILFYGPACIFYGDWQVQCSFNMIYS